MRESEKVINYIYQEIADGRMRLGDRLPVERELAQRLSVSRTTVREAVNTLETMGILESRQGSGNYLKGDLTGCFGNAFDMMLLLQQIDLEEICRFRRMMELEAFPRALEQVTEPELLELKKLLLQMQITEGKERAAADRKFHYLLVRLSGNKLLVSLMEALSELYERCLESSISKMDEEANEHLYEVHQDMINALEYRDEAAGIRAIEKHYEMAEVLL